MDFKKLSFELFLSVIWAEIYDDCPPMGDHAEYRRIVTELFIEGKPAHKITYKDAKGKTQRLADAKPQIGQAVPKNTLSEARKIAEQLKQARLAAMAPSEVESSGDVG